MSDSPREEALIKRLAASDGHALQELLRLHHRRIEAYVRHRLPAALRIHFEPRDILQDVYQIAYRGMAGFIPDGPDAAFRWFITIARNRMIDLLRADRTAKRGAGRRRDLHAGTAANDVENLLEQLAVYHRTPSKSAIRLEMARDLEACMARLPPEYNLALRLRYFEGCGVPEIAKRMGRSPGAAMMLCHRGLQWLKESLASASRYI